MNATRGSKVNNYFGRFCLYIVNMSKCGVVQAEVTIVCELNKCLYWVYGIFINCLTVANVWQKWLTQAGDMLYDRRKGPSLYLATITTSPRPWIFLKIFLLKWLIIKSVLGVQVNSHFPQKKCDPKNSLISKRLEYSLFMGTLFCYEVEKWKFF